MVRECVEEMKKKDARHDYERKEGQGILERKAQDRKEWTDRWTILLERTCHTDRTPMITEDTVCSPRPFPFAQFLTHALIAHLLNCISHLDVILLIRSSSG